MSQTRRRAKAVARQKRAEEHRRRNSRGLSVCPRCGERGTGHFVPPCFGDTGFFVCDPNDGPRPSRTVRGGYPSSDRLVTDLRSPKPTHPTATAVPERAASTEGSDT